jgi:hypothetical protein
MPVREFISLKEDHNFEGFAGNRFYEFEVFESLVDELEEAGIDIESSRVQLDERTRFYSDVLFIPYQKELKYSAVLAIVGARPDEFGLSKDEKFIRLWWD